jgi:hypothetical protein
MGDMLRFFARVSTGSLIVAPFVGATAACARTSSDRGVPPHEG